MRHNTRLAIKHINPPLRDCTTITTAYNPLVPEQTPTKHNMPLVVRTNKQLRRVCVQMEDATLLSPALLQDEVAVENALCVLEGHLQNAAVDQESLLRDLMATPNLFEFAFGGVSEQVASTVKANILSIFPAKATLFETSLASTLLKQLSQYFWHQEFPSAGLTDCHRSVSLTIPVLKALSSMSFSPDIKSPINDDVEDEFEGFAAKRSKQRDWKKIKRAATRATPIDVKSFERLSVEVPKSAEEASALEQQLLNDQKDILMHYLNVLRQPELVATFKSAYIKQPSHAIAATAEDSAVSSTVKSANATQQPDSMVPSAHTIIRPMKAAFYFDSVKGFGDWHILISTRADKNLREAKRADQKLFAIILKKIRELSNGHFSDDNQKRLTGSNNDIPIYEAKMTGDTRLVYQVDCIKEYEADVERQVLRIFGIYTHAQLGRNFWDAVSQHLVGRGKEYKKRCIFRTKPVNAGDKVFSPATFPPNRDMADPSSPINLPDLRAEEQQELHSLIVLEKFVTFSQALLHSILADQDVAHVFHMSPAEQEIVQHAGSCYVIGRSGTGKTTTMLFKMMGIERAYDNLRAEYDQDLPRPRQLFVTQSRVLAEKVQEYYTKLAESHAAAKRTAEESSKLATQKSRRQEEGLVDRDEEEFHHGTLPKSFKELEDEHFPLFVTYDHLCRLLEADFRQIDSKLDVTAGAHDDATAGEDSEIASDYMLQRRDSFVSYMTFLSEYWPHLPQSLTKSLDPALIFAEFMGVIKGSEDSIQSDNGYLEREQYLNVSHRQQGTFSSRRDAVYSLFQAYLKRKKFRRDWDAADRTRTIVRGLREYGVPGRKMDFIYIDEAQDNLLIDALVLRFMCGNPNGLFWAGDTAQTISVGSSFRFDDLKAFLYRLENSGSSNVTALTKPPQEFQLTVNYRSHGGIVNAAHSVVQLITKFWPHAIDALSEERGIVNGLKPIFFNSWDQNTVQYEQFLFGASGSHIEFGARQCIIVRDDAAHDRLRAQVGDIGLVLTIYESKGLEFDDVLLYNFFEDSPVDVTQWRVILNALPAQKHLKCPQFDEARHGGVCRELKFLYVAITRARKNLWIADCSDKGEPLRTFWNAHNLIENVSAVDNVPRLATKSTSEEWAETARALFDNRRYLQSSRSYERADKLRERDVALAYYYREQARNTPRSRTTAVNPRQSAFLKAAGAFLMSAKAANLRSDMLAYYRNAAECYTEAEELQKAGKAYLQAEEHTRAAQVFRRGGYFDEAVDTIGKHRANIIPAEAEKIENVAKMHYFKQQDLERAIHLFPDFEQALEYMTDYGFNVARVTLLEQYGRLAEAAEIHLEEGRPVEAIRLFMRDTANPSSWDRAAASVLQGLWNEISVAVSVPSEGTVARSRLDQLLSLSTELTSAAVSVAPQTLDELAMFRAIVDGDSARLEALSMMFVKTHCDFAAGILCLDFVFQKPMNIQVVPAAVVLQTLQTFAVYARELQGMLSSSNPCQDPAIQKLFRFSLPAALDNVAVVLKGSFLHTYISESNQLPTVVTDDNGGYMIGVSELTIIFQDALRKRLTRKANAEDFICSKASALRLCPAFLAFGMCNSQHCGCSHDAGATGPEAFHLRVRIILQQISICQSTRALEDQLKQQALWLSRYYHALFPVNIKAGSLLDLDLAVMPEAEKGLPVIREWLHDFLYKATFQSVGWEQYLTMLTYAATLTILLEQENALYYFKRANCITTERPRHLIRKNDRYIVQDLVGFLSYEGNTALSAGVLFIKTVCEDRHPIDLTVFCNLVEQLCASYAIAYRLRKYNSLHDLTLSRKWMSALCAEDKLAGQEITLLNMFIELIPTLLHETYTKANPGRPYAFVTLYPLC
ncbi:hypothetical protein BC835DRAFT_1352925 [Cytidiella melzeri]|nr:hypothetical protein BC835DRAFT_1352925 [Cytidiella melzeri]